MVECWRVAPPVWAARPAAQRQRWWSSSRSRPEKHSRPCCAPGACWAVLSISLSPIPMRSFTGLVVVILCFLTVGVIFICRLRRWRFTRWSIPKYSSSSPWGLFPSSTACSHCGFSSAHSKQMPSSWPNLWPPSLLRTVHYFINTKTFFEILFYLNWIRCLY